MPEASRVLGVRQVVADATWPRHGCEQADVSLRVHAAMTVGVYEHVAPLLVLLRKLKCLVCKHPAVCSAFEEGDHLLRDGRRGTRRAASQRGVGPQDGVRVDNRVFVQDPEARTRRCVGKVGDKPHTSLLRALT